MNFLDIVKKRVSCRCYGDRKIDDSVIEYIKECTRLAPSAKNMQPWDILMVESDDMLRELQKSYPRDWFSQAPLVAVFTGLKGESWTRRYDQADYMLCDITIAATHFVLAAEEKGLGTCYIAAFDPAVAKEVLGLPQGKEPLLMITAGYPGKELEREHKRKSAEEIFTTV